MAVKGRSRLAPIAVMNPGSRIPREQVRRGRSELVGDLDVGLRRQSPRSPGRHRRRIPSAAIAGLSTSGAKASAKATRERQHLLARSWAASFLIAPNGEFAGVGESTPLVRTSPARAGRAKCSTGSAGPRPRRSRPASRRDSGSRAAICRRHRVSTRPARSASATRSSGVTPALRRYVEPPQDVVVPPRREGEARPRGRRRLRSRSITSPVDRRRKSRRVEKILLTAQAGRGHLRGRSARPFVLEERLQHADRRVER